MMVLQLTSALTAIDCHIIASRLHHLRRASGENDAGLVWYWRGWQGRARWSRSRGRQGPRGRQRPGKEGRLLNRIGGVNVIYCS
jgi:hypothetical protein